MEYRRAVLRNRQKLIKQFVIILSLQYDMQVNAGRFNPFIYSWQIHW